MLAVALYAIPEFSGSIAIQEAAINLTIIEYELNGQASQFVIDLDAYDPTTAIGCTGSPAIADAVNAQQFYNIPGSASEFEEAICTYIEDHGGTVTLRRDDLGVLARLLTVYQRISGARSASPLETHLAEHLASAFPLSSTAPGTTSPQLRFLIRRRQHLSRFRGAPLSVAQCTFNFGNCKSPDHSHGISWSSESA